MESERPSDPGGSPGSSAGEPGPGAPAERPSRRVLWWALKFLAVAAAIGISAFAVRLHTQSPSYRLEHGDPDDRVWAIRHLAERRADEGAWSRIAAAVDDPDESVRLAAISALGSRGDARDVPRLKALLASGGSGPVRSRAMESLARIGNEEAWQAVVAALDDPSPEVRSLAARCIGRYGRKDLRAALAAHLLDPSVSVRVAVEQALQDLQSGDEAGRTGRTGSGTATGPSETARPAAYPPAR